MSNVTDSSSATSGVGAPERIASARSSVPGTRRNAYVVTAPSGPSPLTANGITRVRVGQCAAELPAVDRHPRLVAPQAHRQVADVAARPRRPSGEHVHPVGEVFARLGGEHGVVDHRIVRHALAHHLDDDQAAAGVAGAGLDVVEEGHRGRLGSGLDDDGRLADRIQAPVEAVVFRVGAAVARGLRQVGPHVRDRSVPIVGSTSLASGLTRIVLVAPDCTCT